MFTTLPGEILELAQHCGALLDGPALASVGVSRATRETLVRRGLLIAIARGMYTVGWLPAELPDWTWFALRSKAFALASAPDAIAAGWSAVALHDLPTLGRPPQLASVFRAGRPPRGAERCARGWTRFASVPEDLMTEIGGVRVLSPAAAAVDVGRRASRLAALVVADGVARRSATSELLGEAASRMWRWPRVSRARWAVARADPDCETPLETVGRFAIITGGLPTPRSNVWIGVGRPRYRWDHYWPEHRLGVEGDGIGTYGLGGHPTTAEQALLREKEREIEVRSWGVSLERYLGRPTLFDPRSLSVRCEGAMLAPPLPAHPQLQWWTAAEGFRLLGMSPPSPVPEIDWESRVLAALRRRSPPRGLHAGF